MNLRLLTIYLITLVLCSVQAQEVTFQNPFQRLSSKDGLPRSEIYNVIQDSKGNMWFSTDAGVVKYDGYYFKTYGTKDGLMSNVVFESFEDPKGRIWFITLSNELCYLEDGEIVPYQYNSVIKNYAKGTTSSAKFIYINNKGDLYYTMSKVGMIKIDTTGELTVFSQVPETIKITRVDDQDMPSFVGSKKFDYAKKKTGGTTPIIYARDDKTTILGSFKSGKGFSFVRGNDALSLTVISENLFDLDRKVCIAQNVKKCVLDTNDQGVIWLLFIDGIQRCTYRNGEISFGEKYLEGNQITDVCWDTEGGMWLTSLKNGIFYSSDLDVFYASVESGLGDRNVTGITEFQGELYYSFFGGYQKSGQNGWFEKSKSSAAIVRSSHDKLVITSDRYLSVVVNGLIITAPYSRDICWVGDDVYFVLDRVYKYNI